MMYYGIDWIKRADEWLRGTKIGQKWEDSVFQDGVDVIQGTGKKLVDGIMEAGLDKLLGENIGKIIASGITEAKIGEIFGKALNPIESAMAKARLELLKGFQSFGEEVAKSWNKADQAAFDYAKQVGMSKAAIEQFRDTVINMSGGVTEVANQYGKTFEELIKLQSNFSEQLGRNVRLTTEQFKEFAAISGIIGDDMTVKLASQLDSFGMSTSAAGEMVTQMYNESVKKGITLQAYSKNVVDNLHLAQQYTFKDGVKGLMSMAENAAKMKMDMQQVVSLTNKLSDGGIESAVNMSAELQVLGGAFAQFANPLGLLHDSLLDMDGLSDRLTNLVGSIGRFDKNEGRVVIDPFQQMQLRQAAKSMGLDYGKLIESANQQGKRKEIEAQMGGNIPEEYRELIMNTAQFKNGKAGVSVNGQFKELASLSKSDLLTIADVEKDIKTDVKEIKKFLIGAEDARQNQEKALENQRAVDNQAEAKVFKGIYQQIGDNTAALQDIVKWQKISAMYSMLNSVKGAFGDFMKPIAGISKFLFKGKANGGIIQTHSDGDVITNGTPGREFVLNSAQYGEFIVNAQSTKHHLGLLRAINGDKSGSLRFKQYADGGLLGMSMMPGMGGMGMIGNMYQLQMFGQLRSGLNDFVSSGLGKVQLSLDSTLSNLKQLDSRQMDVSSKLARWEKLRANTTSNRVKLSAQYHIDKYTKELGTINNSLQSTQKGYDKMVQMQDKIFKRQVRAQRLATGGMSVMAGVSGYMSAKAQYEASGDAIMNKQKAQAGSIGAGIGAAAGAALGSFAGPIGMMIGSTVGQMAGQALGEAVGTESQSKMFQTQQELVKNINSAQGSNKFLSIRGDFSSKEQKVLAEALGDGRLHEHEIKDKDLLTKLKETGNGNIIEKHARGGWIKGRTHASGGELLGIWEGKIHEGENNEAIIPADKAKKSENLVNGILDGRVNDGILRRNDKGYQWGLKVAEKLFNGGNSQPMKMDPIDININGTIKLEGDGKSFDISNEIFKNPTLINKIADLISKQFNVDSNFALKRKGFRKQYTTL